MEEYLALCVLAYPLVKPIQNQRTGHFLTQESAIMNLLYDLSQYS